MLRKIIFSLILITSLSFTSPIYANEEVWSLAKTWFSNYAKKIDKKYSDTKEIIFLKWFSNKLSDLLSKNNFNSSQIKLINDLAKLANERVFKKQRTIAEKSAKLILKTNSLLKDFKKFSYNPEHIFLENWVWYTYKFEQYLKFHAWINIRKEDLEFNNINPASDVVFRKTDGILWFVTKYEKIKLISDYIIYWVPDKYNFLKEIKNDKKNISYETDNYFKSLKKITLSLTKWKSKKEKIKAIYNYILDNIEYTNWFSLSDAKIFSWIDTFKNKNWVCEWYSKIFLYMLNFANIDDVEVIRWYVLDAQDFPKVWHAWVRIWDRYYDPTFDDPIWRIETKKYSEYKYFSMPKDLFYTNRYDFAYLPEWLKTQTLEFRENFIAKKIKSLIAKYKNSWYNLIKPYLLKLNNWIEVDKKLNIEDLKKIAAYYEVNNFKFIKNYSSKTIKTLKYYLVTDDNVEILVKQLNYSFSWYYLFKWYLDSWNYEYRLGYDIKYQ